MVGLERLEDEQLRGFFNVREELSIWIDCCLARGQLSIIPSSLRCKVLAVAHEGHLGMVRMKQRCRGAIWWPAIDRDIEGLVRECEACILSGKSVHPHVAPLQLIPWPSQPWDKIQIDIVAELHVAPQNYRYLIVVHDLCSKWPEVSDQSDWYGAGFWFSGRPVCSMGIAIYHWYEQWSAVFLRPVRDLSSR